MKIRPVLSCGDGQVVYEEYLKYCHGSPTQNYRLALKLAYRGVELNHTGCIANFGLMHECGYGCSANEELGNRYCHLAEEMISLSSDV